MSRTSFIILFVLIACATGLAQTSYMGLTPGKSTKADVERVFGQPLKKVSKTLIEYKPPEDRVRLFVQYLDESSTAIVDRIELTAKQAAGEYSPLQISDLHKSLNLDPNRNPVASKTVDTGSELRSIVYYGAPRFVVTTTPMKNGDRELRIGFYSREMFETALPEGFWRTFFGEWETTRGRMRISRVDDETVSGAYAQGKGTFTARIKDYGKAIEGTWKDSTGEGTMTLFLFASDNSGIITGRWARTSGTGPAEGDWDGWPASPGESGPAAPIIPVCRTSDALRDLSTNADWRFTRETQKIGEQVESAFNARHPDLHRLNERLKAADEDFFKSYDRLDEATRNEKDKQRRVLGDEAFYKGYRARAGMDTIVRGNPAFAALAGQFEEFARRRGLPLRLSYGSSPAAPCVSYKTEMMSKARLAALGEFIAEYERKR